jgi:hypothetical protein
VSLFYHPINNITAYINLNNYMFAIGQIVRAGQWHEQVLYFIYCLSKLGAALVQHGVRLHGSVFRTISPSGIQQCAKECVSRSSCQSFNYNTNSLICELNSETSDTSSSSLVSESEYVYSTKDTWSMVCIIN